MPFAVGVRPKFVQRTCAFCSTAYSPKAGHQKWCAVCVPDKPARHRMREYGLSEEQFRSLLGGGGCGICGRALVLDKRGGFAVDHSHKTGQVRGILCIQCNTRLSNLEDAIWLNKARAYLRKRSV